MDNKELGWLVWGLQVGSLFLGVPTSLYLMGAAFNLHSDSALVADMAGMLFGVPAAVLYARKLILDFKRMKKDD